MQDITTQPWFPGDEPEREDVQPPTPEYIYLCKGKFRGGYDDLEITVRARDLMVAANAARNFFRHNYGLDPVELTVANIDALIQIRASQWATNGEPAEYVGNAPDVDEFPGFSEPPDFDDSNWDLLEPDADQPDPVSPDEESDDEFPF